MRWFIVSLVVCALIGWVFAAFFWPWVGPLIFEPCPRFTRAGVIVFTVLCALLGSWPHKRVWP